MVRPTINSEKHILQISFTNIAEFGSEHIDIVNVVQDKGTGTNPTEVVPGTIVKAVFVEMWLLANGQQPATAEAILTKIPAGQVNPTNAELGLLHTYPNKKNILITQQGLIGDANTNPSPIYKQWIAIPKGKQRFGLGDRLVLSIRSITDSVNICGLMIFKSYN